MAEVTLEAVLDVMTVLVDPETGAQNSKRLLRGESITLDEKVAEISPDLGADVTEGRMKVTSGSMPSQIPFVKPSPVVNPIKGALAVAADATDLASAQTLVNELKGILNAMNA